MISFVQVLDFIGTFAFQVSVWLRQSALIGLERMWLDL